MKIYAILAKDSNEESSLRARASARNVKVCDLQSPGRLHTPILIRTDHPNLFPAIHQRANEEGVNLTLLPCDRRHAEQLSSLFGA